MRFSEYRYLVLSDLHRIDGKSSIGLVFRHLLFGKWYGESFRYNFWMRTCRYARSHVALKYTLFPVARWILHHYAYKFGIHIHFMADIGSGFYIGHYSGMFLHPDCVIGKNCNISQGVTIGYSNSRTRPGCPTLGDNVYLGPGAKLFGRIRVGNNVAIGANCVVTRDIPDNSVVVGVPGRVIADTGSGHYIHRTDYPPSPVDR